MTIRVLYVSGKGRSGSTILDLVLGSGDGFVSVGEMWRLLDRGVVAGFRCGCSRPIPECEVWSRVLAQVFGSTHPEVASHLADRDEVLRWRSIRRLRRAAGGSSPPWPALQRHLDLTGRLYAAVAEVTGAEVIVDSSKQVADPGPLGLVPGVTPSLVHLVRDPRAVAFSWRRRKQLPDREVGAEMKRFSAPHSALSWLFRTIATERVQRRMEPGATVTVRYEDLVTAPDVELRRIVATLGDARVGRPSVVAGEVQVGTNHTVSGNPSRFGGDTVRLHEDTEWRSQSSWWRNGIVTAITAPRLRRYTYPWTRKG